MTATTWVIVALYAIFFLPAVGYAYGRQGRWFAVAGWALFMAGMLLVLGGAGDAFAWAGLLWTFFAGAGLITIALDIAETRRRRGTRDRGQDTR
jgi:hypothetical protein